MESEKKTWMEKAQESAMDTAMKNVASALSGNERGVYISVKDRVADIFIDGVRLSYVTNYSMTYSSDFSHDVELSLSVDMMQKSTIGYQFRDDGGVCELMFREKLIRYFIKKYTINPISRNFLELTVTLLIPERHFHLEIN